jgi:NADH-quinone oxidoreductase subunit J
MKPFDIAFYIASVIAIASALTVVTRRNPVYSALAMLPLIGSLALIFVMRRAPFIAAMQVMVYGGAVVVVFLFVIMLVALKPEDMVIERAMLSKVAAGLTAALIGALLIAALLSPRPARFAATAAPDAAVQTAQPDEIGRAHV